MDHSLPVANQIKRARRISSYPRTAGTVSMRWQISTATFALWYCWPAKAQAAACRAHCCLHHRQHKLPAASVVRYLAGVDADVHCCAVDLLASDTLHMNDPLLPVHGHHLALAALQAARLQQLPVRFQACFVWRLSHLFPARCRAGC